MATNLSFVEYVAEQSELEGRLTWRRMFGEYALYLDGKVIAFACDNSLFIKAAAATAALTADLPQRPPYPGAKDYPVADQLLDEPDTLRRLLLATAQAMPAPVPKSPKKPRVKPPAANGAAPSSKAAEAATPAKTAKGGKPVKPATAAAKTVAGRAPRATRKPR